MGDVGGKGENGKRERLQEKKPKKNVQNWSRSLQKFCFPRFSFHCCWKFQFSPRHCHRAELASRKRYTCHDLINYLKTESNLVMGPTWQNSCPFRSVPSKANPTRPAYKPCVWLLWPMCRQRVLACTEFHGFKFSLGLWPFFFFYYYLFFGLNPFYCF